jgi:hypothetical protein
VTLVKILALHEAHPEIPKARGIKVSLDAIVKLRVKVVINGLQAEEQQWLLQMS